MKRAREGAKKIRKPIVIEGKTEGQKEYLESIDLNDVTICNGPPGSGKSLLAIAKGLQFVQESRGLYNKIVIVRPALQACDEDLGYLPGTIQEKMEPFLAPIKYNMRLFIDKGLSDELFSDGTIEVMPIAFMRGITFSNAVVIFDEAQNSTPEQMKMFLTRIGRDCKAIVEGDVEQSDLRGDLKHNNGLADALDRLEDLEGVGIVELENCDIVRSEIVGRILQRYEGL